MILFQITALFTVVYEKLRVEIAILFICPLVTESCLKEKSFVKKKPNSRWIENDPHVYLSND